MASENEPAQVSPNRFALVICTALGSTIGIAPFCLFLEEFHLLGIVTLLAAIGAALGIRKFQSVASFRPGPVDFLFGTAGAVRLPAGAAIICFFLYGTVYGLLWVLNWPLEWLGLERLDPANIAWWAGVSMAGLLVLVIASVTVVRLGEQLYPNIGGVQSPFYNVLTLSRSAFLRGSALAVLTALGYLAVLGLTDVEASSLWLNLLLTAIIASLTAPLEEAGRPAGQTPEETRATEAIGKLFTALGYESIIAPRSGDPAIDPLLVNLNLLVVSRDEIFAVDVELQNTVIGANASAKAAGDDATTLDPLANLAEDLPNAAWAVDEFLQQKSADQAPPARPMLIVVGREPSALAQFVLERAGIETRVLPAGAVADVLTERDGAILRDKAARWLDVPLVSAPDAVPSNSTGSHTADRHGGDAVRIDG